MEILNEFKTEQLFRAQSLKLFLETTLGDDEAVALILKNQHSNYTTADLSFLADMLYQEDPKHSLLERVRNIAQIVTTIGREEE